MGNPDYHKLKCPKCGNTTDFIEFAMRETKQRLTVRPRSHAVGEDCVEWEQFDMLDTVEPEELVCGKCFDEELVTVWKAAE